MERDIERYFVRRCRALGLEAWKFTSPGRQGVPDRLVLCPDGSVVFVELKTETGRLSPGQKVIIAKMESMHQAVTVAWGKDGVDALFEERGLLHRWTINHTHIKDTRSNG